MDLRTLNIIRTALLDLPAIIDPITIEGPISVSEYILPGLAPKHIYLFGDEHTRAKFCTDQNINTITLEKFLDSTFEDNPDKIIDVYLESEFISERILRLRNLLPDYHYLDEVLKYFSPCLKIDKSECKYKNVRFHYADIRNTTELLKDLTYMLVYIMKLNENMDNQELADKYLSFIHDKIPVIYNKLLTTTIEQLLIETKIHFKNLSKKKDISLYSSKN